MIQQAWYGTVTLMLWGAFLSAASAQTVGGSAHEYLQGKIGVRIGGGDATDMVIEALRIAGGEFVAEDLGADTPDAGDRVWGTLISVISTPGDLWTDSNPTNACLPGDVLQFGGAEWGLSALPSKHSAVVATVDPANGRPASILHQNFNGERIVQSLNIDVTKLTDGWIRIYRPIRRIDALDTWKITLANNTPTSQTYFMMVDTEIVGTISLSPSNTSGSFRVEKIATDGTVPCLVLSNDQSLFLTNAKGKEVFDSESGTLSIRQLDR